jgi:hypothetical protein
LHNRHRTRVEVSVAEASQVITSFRIAATDFRLGNHCRRILAGRFVASVLSSMIARVDQLTAEHRRCETAPL